jgi:endonuclease/exonuclease/phosphatase family metal-dependent hydrolase
VRIGTWNLEGRWDSRHLRIISGMRCDLLLLTEVSERVEIPGMHLHTSAHPMAEGRDWAAVGSVLPQRSINDPHGASALVDVDGIRVCASILPWRACGSRPPWIGATTAEKTADAVGAIEAAHPMIWGGDWNHALRGREWAGSVAGRRQILAALERLELMVPTVESPHQFDALLSIDHIAIPTTWSVAGVEHHRAFASDVRLSDHDAYVVETEPLPMPGAGSA